MLHTAHGASADSVTAWVTLTTISLVDYHAFYQNVIIGYVTFGSLLSQIRLSSVTFVRTTQGVETFGNISRHFVP